MKRGDIIGGSPDLQPGHAALDSASTHFAEHCTVALAALRDGHLADDLLCLNLPDHVFYDPASLAQLQCHAIADPQSYARLRFAIGLRLYLGELEHIARVQAALGAARLALALELRTGIFPLTTELVRGNVRLLCVPAMTADEPAAELAVREHVQHVALLARAVGIEAAVEAPGSVALREPALGIRRVTSPSAAGQSQSGQYRVVAAERLH